MIYYGTILFLFIALTIIPIIVGFLFKNKYIRYFCWLMSIPFLAITISTIQKHSSDIDKQTSTFLGSYQIDTIKSIYKNGGLTNYQGLTLKVNSNNSFVFSDTSLFLSKNGTWKFYDTEDGGFVRCRFPNSTYETEVIAGNNLWGFQRTCFKNGSDGDVIYFKKIKSN
jgi:hypothetical protein